MKSLLSSPLMISIALHCAVPVICGGLLLESPRFALSPSSGSVGTGALQLELVAPQRAIPVPAEAPQAKIQPQPKVKEEVAPQRPKKVVKSIEKRQPTKSVEKIVAQEAPAVAPPSSSTPTQSGDGRPVNSSATTTATPDYLRNPPPPYPRASRVAGEEGTVVICVSLSADGAVENLHVGESSGFSRLDNAALGAVKDWKFKPAMMAGVAVSSRIQVPVKFVIRS